MVSTSRNGLNRETTATVPSVKPEVMEFFQNQVNPNITPEQIENIMGSLNSVNSQPKPIIGSPVNLLYLQDSNNLAAVVIQEDSTGVLYTLSAESDLLTEANAVRIDNLKDFQFRLQDAFNHDSSVSIYYENDRIESLVIIKREQNSLVNPDGIIAQSVSKGSKCHLPPRRC